MVNLVLWHFNRLQKSPKCLQWGILQKVIVQTIFNCCPDKLGIRNSIMFDNTQYSSIIISLFSLKPKSTPINKYITTLITDQTLKHVQIMRNIILQNTKTGGGIGLIK